MHKYIYNTVFPSIHDPIPFFHYIFRRLDILIVSGYLIGGKCSEILKVDRIQQHHNIKKYH